MSKHSGIVHLFMLIPKPNARTFLAAFFILLLTCFGKVQAQSTTGTAQMIISNGLIVLQSDTLQALQLFRQAAAEGQQSGDKKTSAEAYLRCAEAEKMLDSNRTAIIDYRESAHLYEAAGLHAEAAQVYSDLARLQSDLALFEDAQASFRKSDEIAAEQKLTLLHANNLIGSGLVFSKQGNLASAQQNFVDALELFESAGDSVGIAEAWNGIGVVHWKEGKNQEALNAYNESLRIRLSIGDSLGIAMSYSNIGIICRLQKRFDEGLAYYMKALGIRERHHDRRGVGQVLFNIGSILSDMNQNEEALNYYSRSYAIKRAISDQYGMLAYYLNTGEVYGAMNKIQEQEHSFLSGLALADSLHAGDYIKSFSLALAQFYADHNKYAEAYSYHQRYMEIKDTLQSREKNAELARLQADYDLKEKQRDIAELESTQEKMMAREERDVLFRYGLISIIMLVLLFTAFVVNRTMVLRRTNTELEKSKQLVEKRDKEKEMLLREVHHRVKNNLQLTSSLLNLQAREMKDTESALALKEARDRIKAISLVHEELYSGSELGAINLSKYIPDLCTAVLSSNNRGDIRIQYDLEPIMIPLDTSVSLGLMLNEIIINSIKHAFAPGHDGIISITCKETPGGINISVADNGKGIPATIVNGGHSGFGMKLLRSLAVKLGTEVNFSVDHGTIVSIVLPSDLKDA